MAREDFDNNKIVMAVAKGQYGCRKNKLSLEQIKRTLRLCGVQVCKTAGLCPLRDQDMVGTKIMSTGAFELAKDYVRYRYRSTHIRKANTTDSRILSLIGSIMRCEAGESTSQRSTV